MRTGGHALAGGVTAGSTGRCTQTVSVKANSAYTLSAWVRGGYTVAAYNDVGESAKSEAVSARTGGCTDTGLPNIN